MTAPNDGCDRVEPAPNGTFGSGRHRVTRSLRRPLFAQVQLGRVAPRGRVGQDESSTGPDFMSS
jgi:hypothetical protein